MCWLVTEQAKKIYRFHVDPDLRRHVALQNHSVLIVFQWALWSGDYGL